MGVYSLFREEDSSLPSEPQLVDQLWYLHFNGASSHKGNDDSIILYSQGKMHQYDFILKFDCTNNVVEFEAFSSRKQISSYLGMLIFDYI